MAIIAPQTAPNYATGDYFKVQKAEYLYFPGAPNEIQPEPVLVIYVAFYASEAARSLNPKNPMYTHAVQIPVTELGADHREFLYDVLMQTSMFKGTNAAPDVTLDQPAPPEAP